MPRAFITVDETSPNLPMPELNINGCVFRMSERELQCPVEEAQWALGIIAGTRSRHWRTLGQFYYSGDKDENP